MPFTFSHPALILPVARRNTAFFSVSGLIVGSLVPDFEYFFSLQKATSHFSHTLPGLVGFDLPTGLLVCFLFHFFIKQPLAAHLPVAWLQRVQPFLHLRWQKLFTRHLVALIVSVLLGALLHILWDLVVHGTADLLAPLLIAPGSNPSGVKEMNLYYGIWVLYSLAGAFFLFRALYRLPRNKSLSPKTAKPWFWFTLLGLTVVVSFLHIRQNPYYSIDDMAVIAIAYCLLFLLLICAGVILFRTKG